MELNIDINPAYDININTNDGIDIEVEIAKTANINYINSDYLIKSFDYQDIESGSVSIGFIPANKRVESAVLFINTAFDGDVSLTVGDTDAQARLMTVYDSEPLSVDTYSIEIHNVFYSIQTEIKMYFPTGEPTQGEGQIIIYYN